MRPEYLSKKLIAPIPAKDGGTLRTIQGGCKCMAAISNEREQRRHWHQVRELIDQEADVDAVSWQLQLAILKERNVRIRFCGKMSTASEQRRRHVEAEFRVPRRPAGAL